MSNAEGDKNNWFGWTMADNDTWGWASPLDAEGGDDYGGFGGGTPNCNGATARHPRTTGYGAHRRHRPAPPRRRRPVPARRRSMPTGTARRRPPTATTRTRDLPGRARDADDGFDQDCNGADAAGKLSAVIAYSSKSTRSSTKLVSLRVTEAPAGGNRLRVLQRKAQALPKGEELHHQRQGQRLADPDVPKRLRPGAVVTVAVTATNTIGKVRQLTIRRNDAPRSKTLCWVPGAPKPSGC